METLKKLRAGGIITSVLTIVLGILMIAFQHRMIYVLASVIGAVVAIVGLIQLIRSITDENRNPFTIGVMAVVTAFGVWMLFFPRPISNFIPIVMGIFLILHGIDTVTTSVQGKKVNAPRWGVMLLFGVISIILGLICVIRSEWMLNAGMVLLGIMLIYDGISALIVNGKVGHAASVIDSTARDLD